MSGLTELLVRNSGEIYLGSEPLKQIQAEELGKPIIMIVKCEDVDEGLAGNNLREQIINETYDLEYHNHILRREFEMVPSANAFCIGDLIYQGEDRANKRFVYLAPVQFYKM